MIQRFERRSIIDEIEQARHELQSMIVDLGEQQLNDLSQRDYAIQCLSMISNLSSPLIGIQVMKNQLSQIQYPGLPQIEMIFDKAELFYYESIMHDLNKMANEEGVIGISSDDIKRCVEDINWKLSVERSSILNQSQEIGENVDLMKFFEGVRNHQNWQENIQKQCIQKLKAKAHQIQNQLTFKKGFKLCRLNDIFLKAKSSMARDIFDIDRINKKHRKMANILQKLKLKNEKTSFNLIKQQSKAPNVSDFLNKMFKRYLLKQVPKSLREIHSLKTEHKNKIYFLVDKIQNIQKRKLAVQQSKFFNKINVKPMIKAQKLQLAVGKVERTIKHHIVRALYSQNLIPHKIIMNWAAKRYQKIIKNAFQEIKSDSNLHISVRPQLSYKLKGKILLGLNKYQHTPINLKKTFHKWFINTHERKFEKQVYNIWLQGNVSKFTVFMRLKNLVDQVKQHKISRELKQFLKTLTQNFGKYENYNKKIKFQRWIEQVRKERKLEKMFKLLQVVYAQTRQVHLKNSYQMIVYHSNKVKCLKVYFNKYLQSHISKVKTAINKWKPIPDLKRNSGRIKLKKIMYNVLDEINNYQRKSLNIFKKNHEEGQQKKINLCRKAFNQDFLYEQRYFQQWRFKNQVIKNQVKLQKDSFTNNKRSSLIGLQSIFARAKRLNCQDIIRTFRERMFAKERKYNQARATLRRIITQNQNSLKKEAQHEFIQYFKNGKHKKERLVIDLVHANALKQRMTLNLILTKSHQMKELDKREKVQKLFEQCSSGVKSNFIIFDKSKFIFNFLSKIAKNYSQNVQLSLQKIKFLPNRINWIEKQNVITLFTKLNEIRNRNLNTTYNKFKSAFGAGQFRKLKVAQLLVAKYIEVQKRLFNTYRKNVDKMKRDQQYLSANKFFQKLNTACQSNLKILFSGRPIWVLMANHLQKLDQRVKKRLSQCLKLWSNNAQALSYFESIQTEKKKRLIQILSNTLNKDIGNRSKHCIEMFNKNKRIYNLQVNFLKRLCDSQAGKVHNGITIWKNLPVPAKKELIVKATKFEALLSKMATRNKRIPMNAFKDSLYFGNQSKKYCIRKLVAKCSSGIGQYFQMWRNNNKLSILFNKCDHVRKYFENAFNAQKFNFDLVLKGNQAKNKLNGLNAIQRWWAEKSRLFLKKWHNSVKKLKIEDIQKKNRLRNLSNIYSKLRNKTIHDTFIKKCIKIQASKIALKKQERTRSILKMLESYQNNKRVLLNQSFDRYKFNSYWGNFKKNNAFHKFLQQKIQNVHNCLAIWNNLSQKAKSDQQKQLVTTLFSNLHEAQRSNMGLLLAGRKENLLKKKTLENIFRSSEIKYLAYFKRWLSHAKELSILKKMKDGQKKMILERINKLVEGSSTQSVIKAIRRFHMSFKIQKIQKSFVGKLLQTKSGKLAGSFQTWKNMPMQVISKRHKNIQKSFLRLQTFYKSRLNLVQQTLKDQRQNGNLMKKQSILKMFEATSLGIRKFYNRWDKLAKQNHILLTVNATFNWMHTCEDSIRNMFQILFQDQRAYRIKTAAIQKLIIASRNRAGVYFNLWREINRQMAVLDKFQKGQKVMALQIFNKVLGNSTTGAVLKTIQNFKKNANVVRISRNFLNRLLNTKSGKILALMQKMKGIPSQNKKKKLGIIWESAVHRFAIKRLKTVYNQFKENSYEANSKKKYCISKLIRACLGQNKKKFDIWREVVKEQKILMHTGLFEKIFHNIQNNISQNLNIMVKDSKDEVSKKKNLCRKLINNSLFVQHHAYLIWKQAYYTDDIKISKESAKVKAHLKNLINVFELNQNKKAVGAITSFRKILELKNLKEFNFYKEYKNRQCLKFYDGLSKLLASNKGVFIEEMKKNKIEYEFTEKTKKFQKIFERMEEACFSNHKIYMKSQKQSIIKLKAIQQIFLNFQAARSQAFTIWKQTIRQLRARQEFQNAKKKEVLLILNNLLTKNANSAIIEIIHKFSTNLKVVEIKKSLLSKILMSKVGKIQMIFIKWKSLPHQGRRTYKLKAMKFQEGLSKIRFQKIKETFDSFKMQKVQGDAKKIDCARHLVRAKLFDVNKTFSKWRIITNQKKVTEKIIKFQNTLAIMDDTFVKNFNLFEHKASSRGSKAEIITKLFNVNVKRLSDTLQIWKKQTKIAKLYSLERIMNIFNPQQFNRKLLRIGFMMIEKKKDVETLRGYINSLWKWKMSNIEANYYSKFIKVFRESEELITLSNILNKKIYQSIHYGFRCILSAGTDKTNRKKEIVQKYLFRKAKNYFASFRNAAKGFEINIWKSKYTDSIKAKIFTDVLIAIFLRQKCDAMNYLKDYQNYTYKIDNLKQVLTNYQMKNLQSAFNQISLSGPQKLSKTIQEFSKRSELNRLAQTFEKLKNMMKIQKLKEGIQKFLAGTSKRYAFDKIKEKKERVIRARLSISLLQTLVSEQKRKNLLKVISLFSKNRMKKVASSKLASLISNKYNIHMSLFFKNGKNTLELANLLQRFRRGSIIKKILDKQDQNLKRKYFTRMRIKDNNWIQQSIRMFATRISVRTSVAVCLWRMKSFSSNS